MIPSAPFGTRFDPNDDRKRQINTLKVFNDNVSEISPNSEYTVEFVAGENKLAMLILLGPDFPMEKPLLKITPSISHQWVNENSEIVSAPGFLNFSVYSDLGRVVQVIIRELQRNPPPLKQKESPITALCRSRIDLIDTNHCNEEFEESFEVKSSVIGRLHKMSVDELKTLNEDDESLDQFLYNLPHIQSLKQTVLDLINGTEELEKNNVEYEQKIEKLKAETEEKKREFEENREKCKKLYDKCMKLAEKREPINVKKRLKQTVTTLDGESEVVAEKFLEGEVSLEQFLSQYKQLRMQVHSVKVKEDRINQRLEMKKDTPP